jgi:hypothetical protein
MVFEKNAIFILCQDRDCKRWTKLTFDIPGIELDFGDAGIVQSALPKGYHLTLEPAATLVAA